MFCERLKDARTKNNLTGRAIADKLRITPAAYSSWEHGKREPSFEMLVKLCRILDVSADYLLEIEEDTKPKASASVFGATIPRSGYDDLPDQARAELDRYADYLRSQYAQADQSKTDTDAC